MQRQRLFGLLNPRQQPARRTVDRLDQVPDLDKRLRLSGAVLANQTLELAAIAGTDIEIAKTKVLALEEVERCSQNPPWRALLMSFIRNSNNPEIQPTLKIRT